MNPNNVEKEKSLTFLEEVIERNNDLSLRLRDSIERLTKCRVKLTGNLDPDPSKDKQQVEVCPTEDSLSSSLINGQYSLNEMIGVLESEVTKLTQYI